MIVHRKGIGDAPILLSRTPYNAASTTARIRSQKIEDILPIADEDFAQRQLHPRLSGRARDGPVGGRICRRPGPCSVRLTARGSISRPTPRTRSTGCIKNVPESNGKVGMIGSSYVGFTSLWH